MTLDPTRLFGLPGSGMAISLVHLVGHLASRLQL